jgi:hypothetical protein
MDVIHNFSLEAGVFVLFKLYEPSLMFMGKAESLPYNGVPKRCLTQEIANLSQKP